MVKQIYQKADAIKENMDNVWEKLEALENAYHDMLMRCTRIQSNRVCLGALTGEDYPGEEHPEVCPCVEQKEKEEKDTKRQEEREKEEEERRKREERERMLEEEERERQREMERQRRERIIETRKRRFYSRMHEGISTFPGRRGPSMESVVRFQTGEPEPVVYSDDEDALGMRRGSDEATDDQISGTLLGSSSSDSNGVSRKTKEAVNMFKALTDLTKLDGSRMSRYSDDEDRLDMTGKKSLLAQIMEKADGRNMELVVMDGAVKSVGYKFTEDGGMVKEEVTVASFPLDKKKKQEDEEDTDEDMFSDMDDEDDEDDGDDGGESSSSDEEGEEIQRLPFGDFLDLMEVF